MEKVITIGDKSLKSISQEDVLSIAIIEGAVSSYEFWGEPIVIRFDDDKFSDTSVIEYTQRRKKDNEERRPITFFFNYEDFDYHFNVEHDDYTRSGRLRIESLKYLIDKGYDLPIY